MEYNFVCGKLNSEGKQYVCVGSYKTDEDVVFINDRFAGILTFSSDEYFNNDNIYGGIDIPICITNEMLKFSTFDEDKVVNGVYKYIDILDIDTIFKNKFKSLVSSVMTRGRRFNIQKVDKFDFIVFEFIILTDNGRIIGITNDGKAFLIDNEINNKTRYRYFVIDSVSLEEEKPLLIVETDGSCMVFSDNVIVGQDGKYKIKE